MGGILGNRGRDVVGIVAVGGEEGPGWSSGAMAHRVPT